jgi:hypothetical protein
MRERSEYLLNGMMNIFAFELDNDINDAGSADKEVGFECFDIA